MPAPLIQTLWHTAPPIGAQAGLHVFDIGIDIDIDSWWNRVCWIFGGKAQNWGAAVPWPPVSCVTVCSQLFSRSQSEVLAGSLWEKNVFTISWTAVEDRKLAIDNDELHVDGLLLPVMTTNRSWHPGYLRLMTLHFTHFTDNRISGRKSARCMRFWRLTFIVYFCRRL